MEAPVKLPTEPESNPTVAREATDANTRAITSFGIGLAFVIVVSQLLLWWLFDTLAGKEARLSPPVPALIRSQAPALPPEPRLQASPRRLHFLDHVRRDLRERELRLSERRRYL